MPFLLTLIKNGPLIFKIGALLAVFFAGWYAKGVLVENEELRRIKAELAASNAALVEYQETVNTLNQELGLIKGELDNDQSATCNSIIVPCVSTVLKRLHEAR